MALHVDSGFNVAGATCIRLTDDESEITRRYWFDESEMGRLVFVAEIHAGNGARKYIDESKMCLLNQVGERACDYTDTSMIVDRKANILYEA